LHDDRYANSDCGRSIGAPRLAAALTDAEVDPVLRAVYRVRVLEIPNPRWTLNDEVRFDVENMDESVPLVRQERAFTSPIRYTP
jgi:hypothetical protein